MYACDTMSDGQSFYILPMVLDRVIRQFAMEPPQQPRGTKRPIDMVLSCMDLFYKQENDVLFVENRRLQAVNKRLTKRLTLHQAHARQSNEIITQMRQDLDFQRVMIAEILDRFPDVHAAYVGTLQAEEDLDESTEEESEWEQDDLTFEPGEST